MARVLSEASQHAQTTIEVVKTEQEIINFILSHKKLDEKILHKNLIQAIKLHYNDLVKLLVEKGPHPNDKENMYQHHIALSLAVHCYNVTAFQCLMRHDMNTTQCVVDDHAILDQILSEYGMAKYNTEQQQGETNFIVHLLSTIMTQQYHNNHKGEIQQLIANSLPVTKNKFLKCILYNQQEFLNCITQELIETPINSNKKSIDSRSIVLDIIQLLKPGTTINPRKVEELLCISSSATV